MTISQPRPMIELRDLSTEGGRESVPVSRTLLNHPVSYARQNSEFRFLPLRWTAVEEVETPPGSCPQGCGFASVAPPHRNEIAIMRSAHFLWRSTMFSAIRRQN